MMIEELNHWIDEVLSNPENPMEGHHRGYREALIHVKEFIAQEVELMDYEASRE